jgi:hypothetical protein
MTWCSFLYGNVAIGANETLELSRRIISRTMSVLPDKLSVNREAFQVTVPSVGEMNPGQELGSCLPGFVPVWTLAKKRYAINFSNVRRCWELAPGTRRIP